MKDTTKRIACAAATALCAIGSVSAQFPGWRLASFTGPSARRYHAMCFDAVQQRTILFGGTTSGGPQGDTWEWDGIDWVPSPVIGPGGRFGHAMAFHPPSGRIILFGGTDSTQFFGDTWAWDGVSWTQILTPGPSARAQHAMATDAARGRIVMFGGRDVDMLAATGRADTWEWTGSGWAPMVQAVAPGRWGHCMSTNLQPGGVLMYGGFFRPPAVFGDTWSWDGVSWLQVATTGPSARYESAMSYDSRRNRVVLYGGTSSLVETWEWDGATWAQQAAAADPRQGHAMSYDDRQQQLVMFGGFTILYGNVGSTYVSSAAITGTYGSGCGSPELAATPAPASRPVLGTTQLTDVAGIPGSAAAISIGFSKTSIGSFPLPLPLDGFGMTGCWLNHDAGYSGLLPCPPTVGGTTQHSLPIPASPALNGARVYLQALALAPGVNPFGLITSNGVELRLAL